MQKMCAALVVAGVLSAALRAYATDEPPVDKSVYNLFNPTPRDQMRDLDTDRPDTTESPHTIDAGHYQVELSFAEYVLDRRSRDQQTTKALSVLPMLLKVGLLDNVDLQLGIEPFNWERDKDRPSGQAQELRGFGDSELRLKINLWGNEEGKEWSTAFALLPHVSIPTGTGGLSEDHVEGGLILPLEIQLPYDFSLAVEAEVETQHSDAQGGRTVLDFGHTASLSRTIFGDLSGFLEYAGFSSLNRDHRYQGYVDFGLMYRIGKDIQLDGGMRVGVTQAADDVGFFSGISLRF
jgi:hypothetical protein